MQIHHWSLSEIDNMIPWEREIYVNQLRQFIIEQNKKKADNG